ncbi:hypothetical protein PENTCL1PPCAC_7165 [Pristionchus entomophagus]|uniref:Nematode cuticle collagen N-terminal domain-containing protein n=1 Tax=Pristionchus entomophagus TaxID=358040 RepID=A0AAV5SY19_9BILA|nr:hypothetical protein PENTCL1PPCAC_7165 [Pristionchus entomophagus]
MIFPSIGATRSMISRTTKVIAAATVLSGVALLINLGLIISLFVEIAEFQTDVLSDMHEFNTVADQTWTAILVSAPAAAVREKRAAGKGSNSCGCSTQPNNCPRGPIGPRGRPGVRGLDGASGINGPDAYGVAGLTVMSTGKKACIKCAPGPPGLKGHNGLPGERGADGASGRHGLFGRNGLKGSPGVAGDAGVRGIDGADGHRGHPGTNGVRGRGAVGEPGRMGGRGNWGKQGRRGSIGTPGTPGPMGPRGSTGSDGANGLDGQTGAVGSSGAPGKNGEYCKCPTKDEAVKAEEVVKNDRGYEQPQEIVALGDSIATLEAQRLVESSAIKMEALEPPPVSSTISQDMVETTEQPSPPAAVYGEMPTVAAAPAVQPSSPAAAYGDPVEIEATATEEPTPSSSAGSDIASPAEDSAVSTTIGYEEIEEVAKFFGDGGEPSATTLPPGFSPKSFEKTESSSTPNPNQGYDAASAASLTSVVQVTPIYHRATGGGRKTPVPTTLISPVKFVRHAGGWSRRVVAPNPKPDTGSQTHDAELHLSHRASGGARAV